MPKTRSFLVWIHHHHHQHQHHYCFLIGSECKLRCPFILCSLSPVPFFLLLYSLIHVKVKDVTVRPLVSISMPLLLRDIEISIKWEIRLWCGWHAFENWCIHIDMTGELRFGSKRRHKFKLSTNYKVRHNIAFILSKSFVLSLSRFFRSTIDQMMSCLRFTSALVLSLATLGVAQQDLTKIRALRGKVSGSSQHGNCRSTTLYA